MKYLFGITLVSALGGLLFGYDLMVISGAMQFYEEALGIAGDTDYLTFLRGWAASSCVIGCILGSLGVGRPSDVIGRVPLLRLSALLFLVSALWTAAATNLTQFAVARILGGIGMGMAATLSPMYIAEVSPARIRGRFVSLNQLTIVLGILGAQFVNYMILQSHPLPIDPATGKEVAGAAILDTWNGQIGWRVMFGAEAIPALGFLVCALFIPRSPRWLVIRGREEEARAVLTRIDGPSHAEAALAEIETTVDDTHGAGAGASALKEVFSFRLRTILLLGIFLAVFQQWCGINVIFTYAGPIFRAAGMTISGVFVQLVIIGFINVVFTFVGMALVDSAGRKPLLLAGSIGLAFTYTVIGCAFYFELPALVVIIFSLASCGVFAATLGPVVWVVLSEIFPNRIRGLALSISVFSLWSANFILIVSFPTLKANLGPAGSFAIYALICLFGFAYMWWKIPETKAKSLEQIEHELCDR